MFFIRPWHNLCSIYLIGNTKEFAMFDRLKLKLKTFKRGKVDDFKKDERNHAICNRRDTDDFMNDPEDFATPPLRLPTDRKEKKTLLESLRGLKGLSAKI